MMQRSHGLSMNRHRPTVRSPLHSRLRYFLVILVHGLGAVFKEGFTNSVFACWILGTTLQGHMFINGETVNAIYIAQSKFCLGLYLSNKSNFVLNENKLLIYKGIQSRIIMQTSFSGHNQTKNDLYQDPQ